MPDKYTHQQLIPSLKWMVPETFKNI